MKIESRQKLKFKQSVYNIVLFSVIVVVVWIGFEIYFSYKQGGSDSLETITRKIDPITSNLHLDLAESLSKRISIQPSQLDSFKQSASTLSPPNPTPSPPGLPNTNINQNLPPQPL